VTTSAKLSTVFTTLAFFANFVGCESIDLVFSLNFANFTPAEFVPLPSIVRQHRRRVRSTNEFTLPIGDTSDEEWQAYFKGLIIAPLVMIVMFILYFIFLCVQPCCCRCAHRVNPSARFKAYIVFCILCVGSLIAWAFCFAVNSSVQQGLKEADSNIDDLQALLGRYEDFLESVKPIINSIRDNMTSTESVCSDTLSNNPDAQEAVDQAVQTIDSYLASAESSIDQALGYFPDISSTLDNAFDARTASLAANMIILMWGIIMFVMVLFWFISTSVQYLNIGGYRMKGYKRCLARTSCVTMLSIGLLFLALSIIVAAAFQMASTAGSDACAPGPDFTIQRLLSATTGSPILETRSTNAEAALCTEIPGSGSDASEIPSGVATLLCYYQVCNGDNVVQDALEQIAKLASDSTWPALPTNTSRDCRDSYAILNATTTLNAVQVVQGAVSLFQCKTLNDIYVSIVHSTICTHVVPATVQAWQYLLAGSTIILCALALHQHFNLFQTRDHIFPGDTRGMYGAGHTNSTDFDTPDEGTHADALDAYYSRPSSMLAGTLPTATPEPGASSAKAVPLDSPSGSTGTSPQSTSNAAAVTLDLNSPYSEGGESYASGSSSSAASDSVSPKEQTSLVML